MDKKGVWWNSFFYFMNLFSVETFIFFIISPFLVQRERSTSARQTSSSSRRMASCACPWAWRVTASLTAARTSSPTQTRPALRWRHQIITGVNILPTIEIIIKFCVAKSNIPPPCIIIHYWLIYNFAPGVQIHWSSVLLSLISCILMAITMLLCMSCFARILIQWSVRSGQIFCRKFERKLYQKSHKKEEF